MLFSIFVSLLLQFTVAKQDDHGYCNKYNICDENKIFADTKLLFYEVNPQEGFNLQRDVYMRFAIMIAEAINHDKKAEWGLVLPPWYNLIHWKSKHPKSLPWNTFFDVKSLKSFAPVSELYEVFTKTPLEIDTLYVLKNYENAFENGKFIDKWEIVNGPCEYDGQYWGYKNITAKEIVCVRFQGKISQLWELLSVHPSDKKVMISHGEIPLYDNYGTKTYWDCRRSMRFNKFLVAMAHNFVQTFHCYTERCKSYVSVHWRRQDFARSRINDVPSISGAAEQIDKFIKRNNPEINNVFIATDAPLIEFMQLEAILRNFGYTVYNYVPKNGELDRFTEGGVAIIEQIVCSRAALFIGTHESTFSLRIQEEREILGFDSCTTFNRLCPDEGPCEKPSKWTIVK